MSNNIYNPGETYWTEVARLDRILHPRGTKDRSGVLGKIAAVRWVRWADSEQTYALKTARLLWAIGTDRWLSSHLCEYKEALPSPAASGVVIGREVVYNPVDRGGYIFRDYQNIVGDALAADNPHRAISLARREQDQAGSSLPTDETYLFILDALKTAEEATR